MFGRAACYLSGTAFAATFVGMTIASGCTATDDSSGFGANNGTGNAGTGAIGAGGGTGNSSATGGIDFDAGWSDGTLGDGDTCHAETQEATLTPLHMIILVDRSSSMDYYSYWTPTVSALTAFVTDPLSDGLYVGLNYFPGVGSGLYDCSLSWWNPVQVPSGAPPLALLPDDVSVLTGSLSTTSPYGNTPMYGALQGTYDFIRQSMIPAYPNDKHIAVLISDGEPCCDNCPYEEIDDICTQAVAPALSDGIETYTLAIDTGVLDEMDAIAACGGTGSAYDVSGAAVGDFAQHMQDIRGRALGCEYQIPDMTGAEVEFDPLKVNVYITFSGETEPTLIPQKGSAAECGTDDGWYYDDPVNPTKILLCPATCAKIEADQDAKIEIAFGCPTVVE